MCGGGRDTKSSKLVVFQIMFPVSLTSEELGKCLQALEVYVEKHWQTLEVQTSKVCQRFSISLEVKTSGNR